MRVTVSGILKHITVEDSGELPNGDTVRVYKRKGEQSLPLGSGTAGGNIIFSLETWLDVEPNDVIRVVVQGGAATSPKIEGYILKKGI